MYIAPVCENITEKYSFFIRDTPSLVYYSHIPLLLVILMTLIAILIKKNKSIADSLFTLVLITTGLWIFLSLVTWISYRGDIIMTSWSLIILIEPLIFISSLYLVKSLLGRDNTNFTERLILISLYAPVVIFLPTKYTLIGFDSINCESVEGPIAMYYLYFIEIFIVLWILGCLYKHLKNTTDTINNRYLFGIYGILFYLSSFGIGNLIGSLTSNWEVASFGLLGIPVFFTIILYNTTDLRIFNIKISGKNLLIVTLWILIASLVLITDLFMSQIVITITFIISVIVGIILIKSSNRDRNQLETISTLAASLESLNSTLSEKVEEQTKEIKKSYELERKARRELEKLSETKDKFISIAQHNLRIPITNIKNKINSAISRTATDTDTTTTNILNETNKSIDYLTEIADDFKNIAKLNSNSQILNTSNATLLPILENILRELKIDIENMGIEVTYPSHTSDWPELKIDANRIKEVFMVILENAVRYNFKNGKINIKTKTTGDNFEIKIFNTGIGLTLDENKQLFNRSFYRSKIAKELNPIGMGIGLSLSRSIVEAHHGTLEISSKGINMGVTVNITLPTDFLVKYS